MTFDGNHPAYRMIIDSGVVVWRPRLGATTDPAENRVRPHWKDRRQWVACLAALSLLSAGWVRPTHACCAVRPDEPSAAKSAAEAPSPCCAHKAASTPVTPAHFVQAAEDSGRSDADSQSCCPCGCPGDCATMCAQGPLVCPLVSLFDGSYPRPADAGWVVHDPMNIPPSEAPDGVFHPPRG